MNVDVAVVSYWLATTENTQTKSAIIIVQLKQHCSISDCYYHYCLLFSLTLVWQTDPK